MNAFLEGMQAASLVVGVVVEFHHADKENQLDDALENQYGDQENLACAWGIHLAVEQEGIFFVEVVIMAYGVEKAL